MTEDRNSEWQDVVRASLGNLPADYTIAYKSLIEMRDTFLAEIASTLTGYLNRELRSRPQNDLRQKRDLASWINEQTRDLGLCVQGPKSGGPAIVTANYRDSETNDSRFQLVEHTEGNKRQYTNLKTLDTITLGIDPVRGEGPAEAFKKRQESAARDR